MSLESRVSTLEIEVNILKLTPAKLRVMELPKHLQITLASVMKRGLANAEDVAVDTRKARAVESNYLNQLVTFNLLEKERLKRKVYFKVKINES